MSLYPLGKTLTGVLVRLLFNMKYEGVENIPRDKGFILASNHRTAIDPFFIVQKIPQQISFMAKIELFKNCVIGWFLRNVNAFPVDRGKGDGEALNEAKRRIERGYVLAMFIEGHRSRDGVPLRPRSGVALIAGRTGADIVPCAVVFGKKLKFRTKVTVRYGPVIKNENLAINIEAPSTLRLASKSVMNDIVGLIGKDLITEETAHAGQSS